MMARTNQGSFEWMSWRSLGRKNYSHWYLWKKKTTSWGSPTRVGYSNWNQLSTTRPFTNLPRYPPIHVVPALADHILNWWHWGKSLVYPTHIYIYTPLKTNKKNLKNDEKTGNTNYFLSFWDGKSSKGVYTRPPFQRAVLLLDIWHDSVVWIAWWSNFSAKTSWKINISPEEGRFKKRNFHLPTIKYQGVC